MERALTILFTIALAVFTMWAGKSSFEDVIAGRCLSQGHVVLNGKPYACNLVYAND